MFSTCFRFFNGPLVNGIYLYIFLVMACICMFLMQISDHITFFIIVYYPHAVITVRFFFKDYTSTPRNLIFILCKLRFISFIVVYNCFTQACALCNKEVEINKSAPGFRSFKYDTFVLFLHKSKSHLQQMQRKNLAVFIYMYIFLTLRILYSKFASVTQFLSRLLKRNKCTKYPIRIIARIKK